MGRKVSETRPLLSHERSTKHQILPTELEPGTGGLEAHDLATVTLKTNTDVSCAAELRLTSPVPGRTLGGRWGRVDPRPEMADTDRKTSLEDARGLSSRRDDCATFDLTAASSARPCPQSSPLQTPAPSPLPTGREKDCTSRSPPPRSCLQLRRRGWGGVGWGAPQLPPRDPGAPAPRLGASAWVAPPCPAHAPCLRAPGVFEVSHEFHDRSPWPRLRAQPPRRGRGGEL